MKNILIFVVIIAVLAAGYLLVNNSQTDTAETIVYTGEVTTYGTEGAESITAFRDFEIGEMLWGDP